ncbi:MAG: site-specific DNA-methyltransferase [Anaerolineales bacterium]|nr:site-specific DNA-methyltransferase [Anaerolineales bacterium]
MKQRAPRNRTLTCTPEELATLSTDLLRLSGPAELSAVTDRVIQGDTRALLPRLPRAMADLVILDPPYNLTKNYGGHLFRSRAATDYRAWFAEILTGLLPLLKPGATIYVCSDWRTSNLIFPLLDEHLQVRNRITWEREKGRGARRNWKNSSEDIWFCTIDDDYYFDVESVKLKRRVQAPYREADGTPKDWQATGQGNFRLTHPANLWSDITVPFWSMPENTDHPTQKPEKLVAKLILASSRPGDMVFDPFLGSGTSAVVARKLGRRFCGLELNAEYGCWALKRLARAAADPTIQGYADGVFWERNSGPGKGER